MANRAISSLKLDLYAEHLQINFTSSAWSSDCTDSTEINWFCCKIWPFCIIKKKKKHNHVPWILSFQILPLLSCLLKHHWCRDSLILIALQVTNKSGCDSDVLGHAQRVQIKSSCILRQIECHFKTFNQSTVNLQKFFLDHSILLTSKCDILSYHLLSICLLNPPFPHAKASAPVSWI